MTRRRTLDSTVTVASILTVLAAGATPSHAAAPPASGVDPIGPTIHINVARGTKPVSLRKLRSSEVGYGVWGLYTAERWETLCTSPCDRAVVTSNGELQLGGPGVPRSKKFSIASDVERLDIDVRPGRMGLMLTGLVGTSLGVGGVAIGTTMLALDLDERREARRYEAEYDEPADYEPDNRMRRAGLGLALAGTGLLVSGIALLVTQRTRFKLRPHRR